MEREAITTANQLRSPFLGLPGEIRNRIYYFAFCGRNTTRTALLKTCTQTEHESKPIYFTHITLSLAGFDAIKDVIQRTKPDLLARVESIRTSVRLTEEMYWRVLSGVAKRSPVHTGYVLYAKYLPGLKYWHIYGYLNLDRQQRAVEGIRLLMGRDVEVTFDTTK